MTEELMIQDLPTGDERFLMCHGLGPDDEDRITSFGGGLFSWVTWIYTSGPTASILRFYDLDGNEVYVEHNPFAESCAPCHLSAELSPDGSFLAYALWPTAYWQQPDPSDGDDSRAYREWYEQQQDVPTQVVVMEMATGVELFRTSAVADATIIGFDGRIVSVATTTGRQLVDIETGESYAAPPAVTEPAGFWTVMLASLDNTVMDYDAAQLVAGELASQLDVETGVLWSDGFVTLNPGYWAAFTGHFATRNQALTHCEALGTDCYARYVATPSVTGITLRANGLGVVSFGEPAEDAMATMASVLGPPDREVVVDPVAEQDPMPYGYAAERYFRLSGWDGPGLYLVFSDSNYYRDDGVPHFVGWGVTRPGLETEVGIGVGSRVADLVGAYGDNVTLPDSFLDECAGGWTFRVEPADLPDADDYYASMHGELDEDPRDVLSRVTRLHGGATSSC